MLKGNNLIDRTAKEIAMAPRITPVLIDLGARNLPQIPNYMPEDLAWIHTLPMAQPVEDWWKTANEQVILPRKLGHDILKKITGPHIWGRGECRTYYHWAKAK